MTVRRMFVCLLVVASASCGDGGSAGAPPSTVDEPSYVGISGVVGADGRRLTVLSDPMPADSATGPCAVAVEDLVEIHTDWVSVSFVVDGAARPFDGCDPQPRRVEVTLPEPIGDRRVIDPFGARFHLREGRWIGCDSVVVECITQPAACEGPTLRQTVANLDVPRGSGTEDLRCMEPWAVVDVDLNAGACPASGDGDPGCAPPRMRRIFLRIESDAWVEIGYWPGAGCAGVQASAPDFPTALCHDLRALP